MPGESGIINVHYNTNNVGGFSKTVTVTSNAVDNPRVQLRIRGNVVQDGASQPKPQVQPKPQEKVKPAEPAKPAIDDPKRAKPAENKAEGPKPLK
jgi:hypothetical protein